MLPPLLVIVMRHRLQRWYGRQHAHFITCSCYRRQPLFDPAGRKDLFLSLLEELRIQYVFVVFGYVVMPEHVHLLLSEPKHKDLSIVMQVLKQRVSRDVHQRLSRTASSAQRPWRSTAPDEFHFWQPRFHDFNVYTPHKFTEKLNYIHNNPVRRGLVTQPGDWPWSSYRFWTYGEKGVVRIDYDFLYEEPLPMVRKQHG